MNADIKAFHDQQNDSDKAICNILHQEICKELKEAENKIWHRHPVWFIEGNPIVGYSKLKDCIRLMFWSGDSFDEEGLSAGTGKFKDASIRYTHPDQINYEDLKRWLQKSREIQWDYKNIVKRKGQLLKLDINNP